MYKFHHAKTPHIFNEIFTINNSVHKYETRQKDDLHFPLTKRSNVKSTIRVKGVKLWNYTSRKISINCSIESLKINVRKLLRYDEHINTVLN